MSEQKQFKPKDRVRVVEGAWFQGETGTIQSIDNTIYGIHVKLDNTRPGMPEGVTMSYTPEDLEHLDDADDQRE